jgi:hypothetical protein
VLSIRSVIRALVEWTGESMAELRRISQKTGLCEFFVHHGGSVHDGYEHQEPQSSARQHLARFLGLRWAAPKKARS